MKNNFSNFIKIILIIISIVIIFSLLFYIITSKEVATSTQNDSRTSDDENVALIVTDLLTIFGFVNGTAFTEEESCQVLYNDLGYEIDSLENFFDYYSAVIMDCMYAKEYPTIYYDTNTSFKIITESEYNNYKFYFNDLNDYQPVTEIYDTEYLESLSEEEMLAIQDYIKDNYLIAYKIDETASKNEITYSLKRVIREADYYIAIIIANYDDKEYTGSLRVDVAKGNITYSKLVFY